MIPRHERGRLRYDWANSMWRWVREGRHFLVVKLDNGRWQCNPRTLQGAGKS